jgi:hypothetical protein
MKPSKDLEEINEILKPTPPLGESSDSMDAIHEVKEDRLFSQLEALLSKNVSRPLSYFFSKEGLYFKVYIQGVERDFTFFIPTHNQKSILHRLQNFNWIESSSC